MIVITLFNGVKLKFLKGGWFHVGPVRDRRLSVRRRIRPIRIKRSRISMEVRRLKPRKRPFRNRVGQLLRLNVQSNERLFT